MRLRTITLLTPLIMMNALVRPALLPTPTYSAHWLAHPAFADAVQRFLDREGQGVAHYLTALEQRSPFRQA